MNDGLIDGFRYNTWATRELLALCQPLSEDQLNATAVGAYGSIIDTMRHIVSCEEHDARRQTGEDIPEVGDSLGDLRLRVDTLEACWERFLAKPFDAERTYATNWIDGTIRDVPAGIFAIGVLHHGIEHRSQICTILTSIGVPPPDYGSDMGPLDFADLSGRAPVRQK